jgi:hypothetical protein
MKRIVFDSPFQVEATSVATGIDFVRGVPQTVTDEQAAILLAVDEYKTHDPADPKSPANANYGKPLNPFFSEVKEAAPAAAARPAPAPSDD